MTVCRSAVRNRDIAWTLFTGTFPASSKKEASILWLSASYWLIVSSLHRNRGRSERLKFLDCLSLWVKSVISINVACSVSIISRMMLSRDSYGLEGRGSIPGRGKIFFCTQCSRLIRGHPSFLPVGTGHTFPWGKAAVAWNWPLTSI
jgi:hypothetical protein